VELGVRVGQVGSEHLGLGTQALGGPGPSRALVGIGGSLPLGHLLTHDRLRLRRCQGPTLDLGGADPKRRARDPAFSGWIAVPSPRNLRSG
jgi:hypothetical protein